MEHFKIFVNLTRLNKPIGTMLLFWPCSWGLAYAYSFNFNTNTFLYYLLLFFLGSILMRSAGCIFNDIVDKDLDKKVYRTKLRPIASGKISVKKSFLYVIFLCFFAFLILIQFNFLTIALGLMSMFLAFAYPFMKRITYWPQLFLGLTFNWGIIMSWAAINSSISYEIIMFYIAAIFWTLGYDTIYGAQDMKDDEIIGIKSTTIKFKKNIKLFISINYTLTFLILLYIFNNEIGFNFFTMLFFIFTSSLIYQVVNFNIKNPKICLNLFRSNNLTGLVLFLSIMSIY
jgi:4-hydroxybenzoate polyprenyltransferase